MSVREIAEWLGAKRSFALISDYYVTRYERQQVPMLPAATVGAALKALDRYAAVGSVQAEDTTVIRLRSRRWPLDDQMEPPPAAVEALTTALKKTGRLGLPEYLMAAQLTPAQNTGLVRMDPTKFDQIGRMLGDLEGPPGLMRAMLRLVAAQTPEQRASAESPTGLPLAQLPPAQRDAFVEAVTRHRVDLEPKDVAAGLFRVRPPAPPAGASGASSPGRLETFQFTVELPGRSSLSEWLVINPARTPAEGTAVPARTP
jgi:hypothetical protein